MIRPLEAAGTFAAAPARVLLAIALALRAWATLEPTHWLALARRLAPLTVTWPASAYLLLLHGKALRSGQRPDESAVVLERALALRPADATIMRDLARSLRLAGHRDEAIDAWQQAARFGSKGAITDLLRQGERAGLPVPEPGIFARSDHAAWVAANPTPAPPATPVAALFRIGLPADCPDTGALDRTLARQTHPAWTCGEIPAQWAALPVYELALPTDAQLDDQALAWLNHAIARTGCAAVRADHDHLGPDGQRGDPCLLPQPDRLWTERPGSIVRLEARRVGVPGHIAHVPLVLLSIPAQATRTVRPDGDPQPLSIIIPTRDNPAMLATAIASLRQTASRPDRLELVIVDNGSRTPAARAMLDELARDPAVRIVPFAEAFNWSRANNLGAAAARHDRLLFLNDDTEMRTPGWDRILAGLLDDPHVGLVGARMVYPDGRIQHAGFVFGMDNGPQHDGRWRPGDDPGPAGRWTAIREAVAVTGAFIAITGAAFTAAGGFDEQGLAIDFADVDLCLKLRARGRAVAYCGAITLLHHESVSRGLNVSRAKRRRMRREWRLLQSRWGDAVHLDPFHHPAWVRTGAPHDGLKGLSTEQVSISICGSKY